MHLPTTRPATAGVCAILLLLLTASAQAIPIRYTLTGVASGSLGGTPFSARNFTVILEGDTDSVTTWGGDGQSTYSFFPPNVASPPTIQIDGFQLATFITTSLEIFLAQAYADTYGNPLLSFGRPNTQTSLPGWAGMFAGGMTGVSLASEFVSFDAGPAFCSTTGPMTLFTDQGHLIAQSPCSNRLTSISAEFLTTVPVPAAAWLLAGALGTLVIARRS